MFRTAQCPPLSTLAALALVGLGTQTTAPVTLELTGPTEPLYVGQTFEVAAELRIEGGFRESQLVPLFRRELELPVQLALPYLEGLDCARTVAEPAPGVAPPEPPVEQGPRLVVGAAVARVRALDPERNPGGERFELRRRFVASCPGTLRLSGASVRYAFAAGFRDDLFAGRVPLDPSERTAVADALELEVLALPEAGRPPDFGGAVGPLTVSAAVAPRDLVLGQSLRLTLEVRGPAGDAPFDPPRPAGPGWEQLALLGTTRQTEPDLQRVVYDLRPTSTRVDAVPPLRLSYFEPGRGYAWAETEPVTVLVRPANSAAVPNPGTDPGEHADESDSAAPRGAWLAAGAGLGLAALLAWRRRSRSVRSSQPSARARELRAALQRGEAPVEALAAYLAAHLGISTNAVRSGRLARRLVAAGHSRDLSERVEALFGEHDAARFAPAQNGAPAPTELQTRVRALVAELEQLGART